MGDVIKVNFTDASRIEGELENGEGKKRSLEILAGIVRRRNGKVFILQGYHPSHELYSGEVVNDLNAVPYVVNNGLVIEGWTPIKEILFDENYFVNKKEAIKGVKATNILEERTMYRWSGRPCVAFYGKS